MEIELSWNQFREMERVIEIFRQSIDISQIEEGEIKTNTGAIVSWGLDGIEITIP